MDMGEKENSVALRSLSWTTGWMRVLFTEMVNTGEGTDLGGGHQDFRFGHIKFEMIMRHPSRNVMSVQFSSVIQSCPTLCDPKDCCTPGFPVHHQLPELAQTHGHRVSDAINHFILCRPLLLLPSIFPSIRVFFQWVGSLHQVAKVLEFQLQHQCFQWIFRTDFI